LKKKEEKRKKKEVKRLKIMADNIENEVE